MFLVYMSKDDRGKMLNFSALVHECMSQSRKTNPDKVTEAVLSRLTPDEIEEVLYGLVRQRVLAVIISKRTRFRHSVHNTTGTSSPRWAAASTVFNLPLYVGTGWKQLGDCTKDDISTLIELKRDKVKSESRIADSYEDLLATMTRKRAKLVKNLSVDEVDEIIKSGAL